MSNSELLYPVDAVRAAYAQGFRAGVEASADAAYRLGKEGWMTTGPRVDCAAAIERIRALAPPPQDACPYIHDGLVCMKCGWVNPSPPPQDAGCRCGKFGVAAGGSTSDGRLTHTRDRCAPPQDATRCLPREIA